MAAHSPRAVLYHAPPSFYSQIARLTLAEKQVPHRQKVVIPGPPFFDTYAPWYMRLNPGGTVPTLLVDGQTLPDSRDILEYVAGLPSGPSIIPDDPEQIDLAWKWVACAYEIPERDLVYSNEALRKAGVKVNGLRHRYLLRNRHRYPKLKDEYARKAADIEQFINHTQDEKHLAAVHQRLAGFLDELNVQLELSVWAAGRQYSVADVVWTVTVARHIALGLDPLADRPHLARWYRDVRVRPSFSEADIWERFKPTGLLRTLLIRFGKPLALILGALILAWVVISVLF